MIEISQADHDEHRDGLVRLLLQHLTPRSNEKRYDWFYKDNPHGKARVWIARDGPAGAIIGSAAIVPRRMRLREVEVLGCVMADFWIHPAYRVLGPAVRLQRACIDGARELGMRFFLDLPQGSMPAVYKRLRVQPVTSLVRYARPLSLDPYVSRLRLPKILARKLAAAANSLMELAERRTFRKGIAVGEEQGDFGPEFTALAESVSRHYPMCVSRTAEYLNWRYRRHYFLSHHVVAARIGGNLEAYAVFALSGDRAQVMDLFGIPSRNIHCHLIAAVMHAARKRGAVALNLPLLEADPLSKIWESMGFRPRQAMPVIAQSLTEEEQIRPDGLYLTYGDLDY